MTELIGDTCAPSDLIVPQVTTTTANAMSGLNLLSGLIIYNTTLKKLEVFTDNPGWETISSTAR